MLRELLTGSMETAEMNNNINGIALSSTPMDAYHWGQYPPNSAVAGTSELFSSSFAVLTEDSSTPYSEQWRAEHKPFDGMHMFYNTPEVGHLPHYPHVDYSNARYDIPMAYRNSYDVNHFAHPYQNTYSNPTMLPHPDPIHVKPEYCSSLPMASHVSPRPSTAQTVITHVEDSGVVKSRRPSSVSPTEPSSKSPMGSCESGTDKDGSPFGVDMLGTDFEGSDEARVMCLACKGLYPSRRSLTGHIGRNEKCREIIGRNYLDQVAAGANPIAPGTESALRAGALTNGQDGLSPVCPYCDRFISHYKGNIRRHINQCGKNNTGQRRPRSDKDKEKRRRKKVDEGPPPILHEGFEPGSNVGYHLPMMNTMTQMTPFSPPVIDDRRVSSDSMLNPSIPLPSDPSPPHHIKKDVEPPEDAYICGQCEFVTIYKGNMKRHLNTCHPAPDCKDLKEWDRKLESMRASSLGISREEMLERLHAHKMNSTRGRKPRPRVPQSEPAPPPPIIHHPTPVHAEFSQPMMTATDFSAPMHFNYEMGSYM